MSRKKLPFPPEPATERTTWVHGGKVALAAQLGVDRRTINNWSRFPDFPKPRPNGDWPLEDVIEWVKAKGFKGGEKDETVSLRDRELMAKIAKLEFQLDVEKGLYRLKTDVDREQTRMANDAKNILRAKFEAELPPTLAGLDAAEIQVKCKRALDEVCAELSR